ncbi:uncharacterized protein LOC132308805 [Cornus florida]|uniref:uncharacterized protein LOC132308805 n=1 Tax=Cornus florida TaxID=4283 RepID=UPI002898A223|nr:uncharacterized protein LOC132308805 [Cornus florida]
MSDYYIPDDLLIDILCKIPMSDLLNFRRVCKSWASLISSHGFGIVSFNSNKELNRIHHLLVSFKKSSFSHGQKECCFGRVGLALRSSSMICGFFLAATVIYGLGYFAAEGLLEKSLMVVVSLFSPLY